MKEKRRRRRQEIKNSYYQDGTLTRDTSHLNPVSSAKSTVTEKINCWDDLMAVIEFDPLSPLYVDSSHAVNFLVGQSQHCLVGVGDGYGLKLYAHYCLKKHSLKLVLAVGKTKTKNRPSIPSNFFNDCRSRYTNSTE